MSLGVWTTWCNFTIDWC